MAVNRLNAVQKATYFLKKSKVGNLLGTIPPQLEQFRKVFQFRAMM